MIDGSIMPPDDDVTAAVNAEMTNVGRILAGFPGAKMHTSAIRELLALKEKGVEAQLAALRGEASNLKSLLENAHSCARNLEEQRDDWKEEARERSRCITILRTALERVKGGLCYPDEYREVANNALDYKP